MSYYSGYDGDAGRALEWAELLKSKEELTPVIKAIFEEAGDVCFDLITPEDKHPLRVVGRSWEREFGEDLIMDAYACYRMNVVEARENLPYEHGAYESWAYRNPGEIEEDEPYFNPNIALQVEVELIRRSDGRHDYFVPRLAVRVSGRCEVPEGTRQLTKDRFLTEDNFFMNYEYLIGSGRWETSLECYLGLDDPETARETLQKALSIMGPHVVNHYDIVKNGLDREQY